MKRRSFWTCASFVVALLAGERVAHAQACCASPSGFAPARLRPGEHALVGFVASAGFVSGSFGRDRSFATPSNGTREVDLGQRLFVAWAPWERAELSVTMPFVETYRAAGTETNVGGGLGDARVASRWALVKIGADRIVPGVHVLSGLTLPTGTPGDAAKRPLATDASGAGAFQLDYGLALEQAYGRVLVNLTGTVGWRGARDVRGTSTQLGLLFSGFVAVSYSFSNQLSLAASASYEASLAARSGGVDVPDSETAKTTFGISGAIPVARGVRATASVAWNPHISGLGKNELAAFTATAGLVFAWGAPSSCPMHPTTPDCGCPH